MNFEKNRQELLGKLRVMRRDKTVSRMTKRFEDSKPRLAQTGNYQPLDAKKEICLYSSQHLFRSSISTTLSSKAIVKWFELTSEIIDYTVEHQLKTVILDLDPPTDPKRCHEIMCNIKTAQSDTTFLLCGINPNSPQAELLQKFGGYFIQKPIDANDIFKYLR